MQLKPYLINLVIKLYLFLYMCYLRVWETLISLTGPIHVIYYYNGSKFTNITLGYYIRFLTAKHYNGSYFCKLLLKDRVDQFVYTGKLNDIRSLKHPEVLPVVKRLNTMLYHNFKPIEVNLNILDNYVSNMRYHKQKHVLPNDLVLSKLGLVCTDIQTTTLRPFKKINKSVNDVILDELYVL